MYAAAGRGKLCLLGQTQMKACFFASPGFFQFLTFVFI
jgi:hypothetical protein